MTDTPRLWDRRADETPMKEKRAYRDWRDRHLRAGLRKSGLKSPHHGRRGQFSFSWFQCL